MPIFVVQARGRDAEALGRARFVSDRFSWSAFILAPLWLLYFRLWLALLAWVAIEVVYVLLIAPHVPALATAAVDVLARIYIGLEGNRLRLNKWARKSALTEVIDARDRDEAEAIFFRAHAGKVGAMPDDAAAEKASGVPA